MPRSRSSSSDSSRSSSRHSRSKRSKKSSHKRSRDSSRERSHRRDRSSSRDRRRKSGKKISRSSRRSRSRSRTRDRGRSRSHSRGRGRSRSRSKDRSHRRRYSTSRSKSRSRSGSRSRKQTKSPVSPVGPKIQLEDKEDTEMDVLRRNKAIEDIEKSGFEQKSFKSKNNENGGIKSEFEFGTAVEKASYDTASKVIEQLESEGLCHPDWFRDPEDRASNYLKYLSQLKKKLLASGKYKAYSRE